MLNIISFICLILIITLIVENEVEELILKSKEVNKMKNVIQYNLDQIEKINKEIEEIERMIPKDDYIKHITKEETIFDN